MKQPFKTGYLKALRESFELISEILNEGMPSENFLTTKPFRTTASIPD